jgi:hypothetical protein
VDGLGGYNPKLGVAAFNDLSGWFADYREAGHTANSVIYRRRW